MIESIKTIINKKTLNKVPLRINLVDEIQNNLAGKNRFVISDIE
tara:strand:- start:96 stop:227 length:132 start_codon:yes stop_codon:yes gene_type:complete